MMTEQASTQLSRDPQRIPRFSSAARDGYNFLIRNSQDRNIYSQRMIPPGRITSNNRHIKFRSDHPHPFK